MAADSRPGQSRYVLWRDSLRRVPQDDSSQSWSTHGIVRARQLDVISTYLLPSRRDRIDAEGSGHFLLGHSFPRGRGGHHYLKVVDHPRSGVVYDFDDVCLSVCLSDDNFRKPRRRKFIFTHPVHLERMRVKFLYEGHWAKVKVTRTKNVENLYSRNVKLGSAVTLVL